MESSFLNAGSGSRGIVFGESGRVGHVFNVTNRNGRVFFPDGQIGGPARIGKFDFFRFMRTD
ncbi:MAG: hypothetical protein G3M70_15615 [Candidatus Nitronauta litoralis]|uniref:Tox-PL domain-containing protein n=1 Tax=Candidatus Nitronauta litoralis TaxID=2705533 RepID=A0A7T0G1U5_9BACT|nr:MAG: hypothetical protein G3M70_15615 [Candidatus Nitronauta litoralis]